MGYCVEHNNVVLNQLFFGSRLSTTELFESFQELKEKTNLVINFKRLALADYSLGELSYAFAEEHGLSSVK